MSRGQQRHDRPAGFPPGRECPDVILRGPDAEAGALPGKTSDTLRRSEIPSTATAPAGRPPLGRYRGKAG